MLNRHEIPDIELRTKLADRGLCCHLLISKKDGEATFPLLLCSELQDLTAASYGRKLSPEHVVYETWAVTIGPPSGPPVACSTLSFRLDFPSFFTTRFEAVHPTVQKTGLGRLLYECIAVWIKFLIFNDPLVTEGVMQSLGTYYLVSCIDAPNQQDWESISDNPEGHGTFLRKLGFIRAQHDFDQQEDEIAFQREFHIPIHEELEEKLGVPARPSTA